MVARAAIDHCRAIGDDVVALTRQQLDIADRDAVLKCFDLNRPAAVLNCAAFTDVDGAESKPEASHAANTIGVRNLAEASASIGSRFVTISTDYVFDGANLGFYMEDDEPNPRGVYAETKYAGELAGAVRGDHAAVGVLDPPFGDEVREIERERGAAAEPDEIDARVAGGVVLAQAPVHRVQAAESSRAEEAAGDAAEQAQSRADARQIHVSGPFIEIEEAPHVGVARDLVLRVLLIPRAVEGV